MRLRGGSPGRAGRRVWASVLALFVWATTSAQAAEPKSRIRYAEPVALPSAAIPATAKLQRSGQAARIAFDAFGRRFDLELESNDRLLRRLPAGRRAELPPHDVYRGRLAGLPGSWVRLTRLPDGLYGAIWDGSELYSIVPAHAAAAFMGGATPPTSDQPLIYRASDVDVLVGGGVCTVLDARGGTGKPMTAGDQFKALLRELPRHASAAAAVATLELEVAMIGDFEFFSAGTDPIGELLARVNIVDGIFSEQVGVKIAATELKVFDDPADPFTSSAPGLLLDEVGSYRVATPAIAAADLAHLVTGRDLSGSIVGIAYLFGVCEAEIGVSLSERFFDPFTSALIAAHEFGHNLGAPHDAETGSPCRTTPPDFLMNPSINGSDRFSQCSLDQMAPVIAASTCIRERQYVDVGLALTKTRYDGHTRTPIRVAFDVVNHGTASAESTGISIALDSDLVAAPVSVEGGSCATGPGNVTCQMANIAPGARRRIEIDVTGSRVGAYFSSIAAAATRDENPDNDEAGFQVNLAAATDASITALQGPITVLSGNEFEVSYLIRVNGIRPLLNASVETSATSLTLLSGTVENGNCAVQSARIVCNLGDIPPGATRRMALRLRADRAGGREARSTLRGTIDDFTNNNFAMQGIRVDPLVDLVVRAEPGIEAVHNGEPFARSLTVLSVGPREAREASVRLSVMPGLEILSVAAEGASCEVEFNVTSYICRFASPIESGGARRVDLNLRGTKVGIGNLSALVMSPDNQHFDGPLSTQASFSVEIRESADVKLDWHTSLHGHDLRPVDFRRQVTSVGWTAAESSSLTLTLPAGVSALSAVATAGTCTIAASSVRCDFGSLEPNAAANVYMDLQASRPGEFTLTVEAHAANDTDSSNNTETVRLTVDPNIDVRLDPLPDEVRVRVGRTIRYPITVRSASHPVANVEVRVDIRHVGYLRISAPTTSQGSCTFQDYSMNCALGAMPANSSALVELDLVGENPIDFGINVDAIGDQDIDPGNGSLGGHVIVDPLGNVAIDSTAPTSRPRVGVTFDHPGIAVFTWTQTESVRLTITVPPAFTIESAVPDIGQCVVNSGIVECAFGDLAANERRNVALRLRANQAGTFTTSFQALADEDSDTSDNSASVTIDVDAAPSPPPPPPPSSSGGGGGSLDWLSLTLGALGLGVRRRRRIARSA